MPLHNKHSYSFLEFDFHAASRYPICNDDIILICNPSTHSHNFFAILTFEQKLPHVPKEKGLCSLCEDFCTYVEQHDNPPKSFQTVEETTFQTAEKTNGFCRAYPYNPNEKIMLCLEKLNEIVQNEAGENTTNGKKAKEYEEKIKSSCFAGICECKEGACYVREANNEWR